MLVTALFPFPLPLFVVLAFLRERGWPKSSAARSAAVADFLGSGLEAELGATYTMLLERDGEGLLCLVRDRAVLSVRVVTRPAMMEDYGWEMKATGALWSIFPNTVTPGVVDAMQIQRSTSTPSNIDRPQSSLSNRPLSRVSTVSTLRPSSSLGHSRSISRLSQRPASRHSQRPPSRQSHHAPAHSQISSKVSGLIHTLVAQITGITNESDPENYKIACDYANKHLELGMLGISGVVGIGWDMNNADTHFSGCVRALVHPNPPYPFGFVMACTVG